MYRSIAGISAILILVVSLFIFAAPSRETLNLQGRVTDSSGVPISGATDFVIKIYTTDSGGSPIFTETQSAVNVVNGIYNLEIGAVTALSDSISPDMGICTWSWANLRASGLAPSASPPMIKANGTLSFIR